jgi:hypothetical protein
MVETAMKKLPSPNSCNCVCIVIEQDSSQKVIYFSGIMQLIEMMDIFNILHQGATNNAMRWAE